MRSTEAAFAEVSVFFILLIVFYLLLLAAPSRPPPLIKLASRHCLSAGFLPIYACAWNSMAESGYAMAESCQPGSCATLGSFC